ncbi:MAG: hypothetical protein CL908_17935 [Deltaproteobacteria bacterium]|nr:hypothetical protein [Deltaproteobacteria bacterium]
MQRRDFLCTQLAAGLGLCSGVRFPGLDQVAHLDGGLATDRTLLLVELTGGNDGLNTIVPFGDDLYHRARPVLAAAKSAVHQVDQHTGYAPTLERLAKLHQDGHVAVVQGVGMASPDRSHFLSLDRWHSGDPTDSPRRTGWIGRALAHLPSAKSALPGLALGDRALPLIFHGTDRPVAACDRLKDLVPPRDVRKMLESPGFEKMDHSWGNPADRRLIAASRDLLAALSRVAGQESRDDGIVQSPLGQKMSDVLAILRSNLRVPAVFVRTGGFDTHARQDQAHPQLLNGVDGALAPFFRALVKDRLQHRVLVIVYSEFGRRVKENGSRGTDHGSAGPVLLLGGGVKPGLHGSRPNLDRLDNGDVKTSIDFRRILAQGLRHLQHPDPVKVLGKEAKPLF